MVFDDDSFGEEETVEGDEEELLSIFGEFFLDSTTRLLICVVASPFSNKLKVRERGWNSEGEEEEIDSSGDDNNFTTEERGEKPFPTSIDELSRLDLASSLC